MTSETTDPTTSEYLFDSGTDLGRSQLRYLQHMLDPSTVRFLADTGVGDGRRCLDLGAGGGSVARWLAERVGPSGTVVAADLDTTHLDVPASVRVHEHDLNDGLPEDGPYDLIHARLLLLHLPRREEILRTLAAALAPGGRLVLGEFGEWPGKVLAAPSEADAELFGKLQHIAHHVVSRGRGVSWTWAREADARMAAAGLTGIRAEAHSWTIAGGDIGCRLARNYVLQAEPLLLRAGLTESELRRYCDLMLEPGFRSWFYEFVCTSGQKPAG